jgi:hypothetical protein
VAADARLRAARTTPFQAGIIRDGSVTFAEYRASILATVRCLRTQDGEIVVNGPYRVPGGDLEFRWHLSAPSEREPGARGLAERTYGRCNAAFAAQVGIVYSNLRVIPPARRRVVLGRLVRCLRTAGIASPNRPSMPSLLAVLDRVGDRATPCTDRYTDFFRLPEFLASRRS